MNAYWFDKYEYHIVIVKLYLCLKWIGVIIIYLNI